ncbi:hypothetical protein FQR65_LT20837 [Abscondita terminalis]|nr:hypothetical protein FQR65_LT20837 [Abscondita terminalis]
MIWKFWTHAIVSRQNNENQQKEIAPNRKKRNQYFHRNPPGKRRVEIFERRGEKRSGACGEVAIGLAAAHSRGPRPSRILSSRPRRWPAFASLQLKTFDDLQFRLVMRHRGVQELSLVSVCPLRRREQREHLVFLAVRWTRWPRLDRLASVTISSPVEMDDWAWPWTTHDGGLGDEFVLVDGSFCYRRAEARPRTLSSMPAMPERMRIGVLTFGQAQRAQNLVPDMSACSIEQDDVVIIQLAQIDTFLRVGGYYTLIFRTSAIARCSAPSRLSSQ